MSHRRIPTASELASKAARRERFTALAQQLAAMTDEQREQMATQVPTIVTCEGRPLSIHNTLLVALQHPAPTMVGGFRQWLAVGRAVRKGEHGLMIWAPTGSRTAETDPASTDAQQFVMVTVFDVSQTDAQVAQSAA